MLNYPNTDVKEKRSHILMKLAGKLAVGVASMLFVLKIIAWWYTGSMTIKLSCLDSGFDIGISLINFFILKLTLGKKTEKFAYGYDKAAALASISQACIMLITISYAVYEVFQDNELEYSTYSLMILIFSTLVSMALLSFQGYVVKETGSIIIKTDMLHYKTDLFINVGSIASLILFYYTSISSFDSIFALLIAIYLIFGILKLIRYSIATLMDKHISNEEYHHIVSSVENHNAEVKSLNVLFSGVREIIYLKIKFNPELKVGECIDIIQDIEDKVQNYDERIERVVFTTLAS